MAIQHLALATCLGLVSSMSLGAVSNSEATALGNQLTPIGAEKAGNAANTIPAWTGKPLTDSHALEQESPLFEITAQNYQSHQKNLSSGQIAMLLKYPDSYKISVYPSHRTATYAPHIYELAKRNATQAELVKGGNGLKNFQETVPFPIPKNGLEVIWNHITRYRGGHVERTMVQAPVQENGKHIRIKIRDRLVWPQHLTDGYKPKKDHNMLFYYTQKVMEPARLTGNVLLVHETIDQVAEPRSAWVYNAGQRRVRRAPQVAYDSPGFASEGSRTTDNFDMYNGAPDRYDWKLIGKQELYIPYNSFKLASKSLSYDQIIHPRHLNPEHTRHELHRVWVVEATLKDGERHVYAKRRFYIDEDTWQAAVIDHYDGRGELWRMSEAHELQYTEVNVPWFTAEVLHDLLSGRYLVIGLTNEESKGFDFNLKAKHGDFTPAALRRSGKR